MRRSGILMHISSLPGEYGIGKLGQNAKAFIDFLSKAGINCWQVLPLSPTGYGDSPYQSSSAFAGNPYFIDFDTLCFDGMLCHEDYKNIEWYDDARKVDYGTIYNNCFDVLRKAYKNWNGCLMPECKIFFEENGDWLEDYALYCALKQQNDCKPWYEWPDDLKMRKKSAIEKAKEELSDEIGFQKFIQLKFYEQWLYIKKYANERGIEIIGDIPIYCAYDSVEAWCYPELFQFDKDKKPISVAGCPPDAFSPDGQLWGNPVYDWDYHKKTNFEWWLKRIGFALKIYDITRIDHFRGFESYYAIPFGSETAANGKWEKAMGSELFALVHEKFGEKGIIAEDLGFLTPEVKELLEETGYPGMKVLQFAFDNPSNVYLPHNHRHNCVVYTGTHDNDTLQGWIDSLDEWQLKFCLEYCGVKDKNDLCDALIRIAWTSNARYAIAQIQDFLHLGTSARMNTPSSFGSNWCFRTVESDFSDLLANKINRLCCVYDRLGGMIDEAR